MGGLSVETIGTWIVMGAGFAFQAGMFYQQQRAMRETFQARAVVSEQRFEKHDSRLDALRAMIDTVVDDLKDLRNEKKLDLTRVDYLMEMMRARTHRLASEMQTDRNVLAALSGKALGGVHFDDAQTGAVTDMR